MRSLLLVFIGIMQLQLAAGLSHAETGRVAWLRYAPLKNDALEKYAALPASVVVQGDSAILDRARDELIHGIQSVLGRTLRIERAPVKESAFWP